MTGNLQAIGFLFTGVLGWGIGGALIDAGLINAGVYSLESGQLGTATPSSSGACSRAVVGCGFIGAGHGRRRQGPEQGTLFSRLTGMRTRCRYGGQVGPSGTAPTSIS